jgi:hypothetical protein
MPRTCILIHKTWTAAPLSRRVRSPHLEDRLRVWGFKPDIPVFVLVRTLQTVRDRLESGNNYRDGL